MPHRTPTKWEVVTLALSDLGAASNVVDTEDIAVRTFQLAPASFGWRKYPEQIDLDSVRVSLTDACKPKYGALAAGSVKTGWHLTPSGVEWVASKGAAIRRTLDVVSPATRPEARQSTSHFGREAARLRSSPAFRQWSGGSSPSPRAVAAAFRVDSYTTQRDRELKLNRLLEASASLSDATLERFVKEMAPTMLAAQSPRLEDITGGNEE